MLIAAGIAAVVLPGCMQVDYVGQHYTPTENVAFIGGGDTPANFDMMGRATLTAPEGYNSEEIRQKLLAEAKSVGADAVIIESVERQQTGSYETVDNDRGSFQPRGEWASNTFNADGTQNYTNTWGQTGADNTNETKQYQVVVKSYFLREKSKNAKTEEPIKADKKAATAIKDTAPAASGAKPATVQ